MSDTIIAFISGFIVACITSYLAHVFSKRRDRRKEFNQAAENFIAAFQEALSRLRYDSRTTIYDIITPELIKHEIAHSLFCHVLSDRDLDNFKMAWKDYFVHTPHPGDENKAPEHHDSEWEEEQLLLIKKIETLLEFAKLK